MTGEPLVCLCGEKLFERKVVCKYQLGSKFLPLQDFVPTDQYVLARCMFCGLYFDINGAKVELEELGKDG